MAEIITEIAYGAHKDDEDGGHDYIQMQWDTGVITFKTVQGYWVEFFPWSMCPMGFLSHSTLTRSDSEAYTALVPVRSVEARCVEVEQRV